MNHLTSSLSLKCCCAYKSELLRPNLMSYSGMPLNNDGSILRYNKNEEYEHGKAKLCLLLT